MKLKLNINPNKKIVAWIQKNSDLNEEIQQIFKLFKDNIKISRKSKFLRYYVVTSENPAIILSIFSSIQESIPEVFFNDEDSIEIEDFIDGQTLC